MTFKFSQEVFDLGVRGEYFNISGMMNRSSSDPQVAEFVQTRLDTTLENIDSVLEGFHSLHHKVSAKADKLIASPEGLRNYVKSHGDIPRINGIVDVYNAISLSTGIAVGAHDLAHVEGSITLRLTTGEEGFVPLGMTKLVKVPAGEYSYIDDANDILCRLEVRQVEKTKIVAQTTDAFFIVQGHTGVSANYISDTARLLSKACTRIFGGKVTQLYP